ncbi:malate dehydrogenase (quinone) [Rhizobium sp. CFBP 8762]|uniref:malate dehydrogenase (quinone) n=1 Tax=Rhizobium sp. CFBP 8762 TaxID=2775279 RepID=UPI00177EEABB|nr:malate dehydrogenase (quinone) [Rhizobium sp. CFBP 8762]MBD8553303.1 malate dehydrogenase (quinone) [Rhizobium sp. CFBP 8762]
MSSPTVSDVFPGTIQSALPLKRRQVIGGALAGLAVTVLPGCGKPAVGESRNVDVLLIGGGIMSSTLGMWLRNLEPNWSVEMIERLDGVALESSNGWNNAGTGHAALAELNYTPEDSEGNIKIAQAIKINEAFQISRQFWAYHVEQGVLKNPRSFINHTPHMSFVWGEENAAYLRKRYDAMQASPLFSGMEYSEDPAKIAEWVPLMMEGRDPTQKIAATWSPLGTDMEFGEITRQFVSHMQSQPNFRLNLSSEVDEMERNADGTWRVTYRNLKDDTRQTVNAKFVFVGAGGAALHLLQMSGISEIDQYGGFPVGGSFLVNDNPDVAMRHLAKAYGKASVGSPPMSVPHLDTRVIDGKRVLLFGPFATFSTRFLKDGSYLDLLSATNTSNLWPMMKVGVDQYSLIEYLAGQLMLSDDDRFAALQEYFPGAKQSEWRLWQAGQRVQIIKKDAEKGGVLKLGTEVVSAQDGSIAGLLGASPGASTAVPIMLSVLEKVFADKVASPEWQSKIQTIVPGYGAKLGDDPERIAREWVYTSEKLDLPTPPKVTVATSASNGLGNGVVKRVPDMAL